MQWINLVPEDAGAQNLRRDNRRPTVRHDVDAVSPYPSARPPRIDEDMRDATEHRERRAGDRRADTDRRKEQIPVLLDTRCKHDRRAIGNRRSPPSSDTDTTRHSRHSTHLNLYA